MEIRVLGAHNRESATTRCFSLLVDGRLAVDAGSLGAALTLDEQAAIEAILLTHHHLDHIKDLPTVAFNTLNGPAIDLYTNVETRDVVRDTVLAPSIWLPFFAFPPDRPRLRFHEARPWQPFDALGYRVTPIEGHHKASAMGFYVERAGRSFLYTSDTGPGLAEAMRDLRPDLLITEVTLPNAMLWLAEEAKHLTPALLQTEIERLQARGGPLPRLLIVHVDPQHEWTIHAEIEAVRQATGATIDISVEDQRIEL